MPTISQLLSVSYNEVKNEQRKPANQWANNYLMAQMEKMGFIEYVNGAPQIEVTLDYKRNPGAEVQAGDLDPVDTSKTDVLSSALYDPAQFVVPIVWSRADEAKNSTPNQKVSLTKSLIENALNTHDDVFEEMVFTADTNGFLGLPTIVPDDGQGTVGGIDAATDIWWRNPAAEYDSTYADLQAVMTAAWNSTIRSTGSSFTPKLLVSGSEAHAGYEGTLTEFKRFQPADTGDSGFKLLAFKSAVYGFSAFGDDHIYFLNPKTFQLVVFKNAWRDLGETVEFESANGYIRKIFSMAQTKTPNKSRNAVIYAGA
jgi:hypothetical protein